MNYTFESYDHNNTNLEDNVILYNCGNSWKVIPLNLMLSYPIIYDTYLYDDEKYDITIVVCPITLRCVMFKGIFEFYDYENLSMFLTDKDEKEYLPIDLNKKIDKNFVIEENKRIEVKIMTLKNAILYANDIFFIKTKEKINFIINEDYYNDSKDIYGNEMKYNSVHPKTLVYIVNFESQTNKNKKIAVLIGNDYSKNKVSGYDVIKSKLNDHLMKYRSKIIKKDGYIMPILWYIAKELYEKEKLVYLK